MTTIFYHNGLVFIVAVGILATEENSGRGGVSEVSRGWRGEDQPLQASVTVNTQEVDGLPHPTRGATEPSRPSGLLEGTFTQRRKHGARIRDALQS